MTKRFTFKIVKVGGKEYFQIHDENHQGVHIQPAEFMIEQLRREQGLTVEWSNERKA